MCIDIKRVLRYIKWKSKIENNIMCYYLYKRGLNL